MNKQALKSITIKLATLEDIHKLSDGEVKVDATFAEDGIPVSGGLFCRDIFGADGKGFGHIELASPVVHPWFEGVVRTLTGMDDLSDGNAVLDVMKNVDLVTTGLVADGFIQKCICSMNKSKIPAERLVLQAIPVVPPAMRPLVKMSDGVTLSSDLNELYMRVVARNNALKELLTKGTGQAPGAYVRDTRDRLNSAVRALIGGFSEPCAFQSLTDLLTSPNGFLKRNLHGKRADYSGRSVIVSGPNLKLDQCGLPVEMALEQFKPFVARQLVINGAVASPQEGLDMIALKPRNREVRRALEMVAATHLVLLNRAPTLHRLGIQPFRPVLVDHRSIMLHPLACYGFNADFDGDQMAVHVPLSECARAECEEILESAVNLVSPANGSPITGPVQDIVLGLWYLTSPASMKQDQDDGETVESAEEVVKAVESCQIHPHTPIVLRDKGLGGGESIKTTAGRVLFNANLPSELRFINEQTPRERIQDLVARCLTECGRVRTRMMLDDLNSLGFEWATRYAPSCGLGVIPCSAEVKEIRDKTNRQEQELLAQHDEKIDSQSFDEKTWDLWSDAVNSSRDTVREDLASRDDGMNPIYTTIASGARAGWPMLAPSFGITGMVWHDAAIQGARQRFDARVASNYWEGLDPLEHFSKTFGARKSLVDTHIRTFDAISMMTKLIYAAQSILITAQDCGTDDGVEVSNIEFDGRVLENVVSRIRGRVAAADIKDTKDNIIVKAGDLISKDQAAAVEAAEVKKVMIRSAITCRQDKGVCAKCYGEDLSYGEMVKIGTMVGVIAAQAMSEPAVQLTLRTFYAAQPSRVAEQLRHPGGLAQMIDLLEGRKPELRPMELVEEAERILRFQGVDVNDKHFELLARRIYSSTQIEVSGDTCLIPGEVVDNELLKSENTAAESAGGKPATGKPAVRGASEAAANSSSVIGSAAINDSQRVLTLAALAGARDDLDNALERIVVGLAPHYHSEHKAR